MLPAVPLHHELAAHYAELRAISTRARLVASPLWAKIGREVEALLDATEHEDATGARPLPRRFRALAWNIQRGTHLDELIAALTTHPELRARRRADAVRGRQRPGPVAES